MHGRLAALRHSPPAISAGLHFSSLSDQRLGFVQVELQDLRSSTSSPPPERPRVESSGGDRSVVVEISHPWPEWVNMMELLIKNGFLGSNDFNAVRTGCLDFARSRPDLIRYLSRWNTQMFVKCGCPSLDRKVVNSAKRLRAHLGVEEGDVCSSCSLRGKCDRAFVKARDDEVGRTVDVMRILLTYGLDIVTGLVENPACTNKTVKESVRKVLDELVEYSSREIDHSLQTFNSTRPQSRNEKSNRAQMFKGQIPVPMKQGDWICPKCNFLNFAKNIKCLRCSGCFEDRLQKLREDREHLPLRKGDWICEKCNFFNFAKNIKCMQCQEKPTNRQLNPGEWECPSCNYINFQKNMVCLKCDWKRPKSIISEKSARQQGQVPCKNGYSFVRDGNTHGQNLQRQDEESDNWDSEDDCIANDNDKGDLIAWKNFAELENFPVLGGKGAVSQDPLARERWKEEMKGRNWGIEDENNARHGHCSLFCVPSSFKELDDGEEDDDIVEWFRVRKAHLSHGIQHSKS